MNNVELATIYLPLLDEVYKSEAKTSILDGDEVVVQKGQHGEIKIAKLDMDGLGDFTRNSGYTKGSTKLIWESIKYDKERSQELRVDRLDNEESLGIMFSKLSSEFIRTKVIPETDAARFAKIASTDDISKVAEAIEDTATLIAALRASANKMDEDEVPEENRILFITPTLLGLIDDLDTNKSKKILERFSQIIKVPQNRFYTAVTLNDGNNINLLCAEKSAVVTALEQFIKYFAPDQDQNGDDHVFDYRNNNLYAHIYENKKAGIYLSYDPEV